MSLEDNQKSIGRLKTTQNFPVLSSLAASLLIVVLILSDYSKVQGNLLIQSYPQVEYFLSTNALLSINLKFALGLVFLLLLFFDVQRFSRKKRQVRGNAARLKQEVNDAWESKKRIQSKAHIYSGHADKLKLFISDKLLEYIEYDEKFLHFKSIASEVRHNGVISYDVVKTALQQALNKSESNVVNDVDAKANEAVYQNALDAMRYLWDLLDLSTADNIGMHIANQLIECEEHYYQMVLNKQQGVDSPVPYHPDFSPVLAAVNTLPALLQTSEELSFLNENITAWQFEDDQLRVALNATHTLLGNENHIRLVLENLLKNAQHFSKKVPYKQKSDRIGLTLKQGGGYVEYEVYNRGSHVSNENKEKVFQLGYSTRRVKEHHGKGLGLFFVNEIVKGYEGQINVRNIHNEEDSYSIRIALKNGEVITKVVTSHMDNERPLIRDAQQSELVQKLQWQYTSPVISVEVSSSAAEETRVFDSLSNKETEQFLDKDIPQVPRWLLEIKPKRGANKLYTVEFSPLDVRGVSFVIKLPSAESRLEGDEAVFSNDIDQDVEVLNSQFKEFDDY